MSLILLILALVAIVILVFAFLEPKKRPTNVGRALRRKNSQHRLGESSEHIWVICLDACGHKLPIRLTERQWDEARAQAERNLEDCPPYHTDGRP
jgi:hypothetical protein